MARTAKRRVAKAFPAGALGRALRTSERASVRALLHALLRWQRDLRRFPASRSAPDATPFVSLYARGKLLGCYGSAEGRPGDRLARAFLRSLEDMRFGGVGAADRGELVAQVSYLRAATPIEPERAAALLEPGTHGVAITTEGGASALVLPMVARSMELDALALLRLVAQKAGLSDDGWKNERGRLWLLEVDDVVARPGEDVVSDEDCLARAARWLAGIVGADGSVTYAIHPRSRDRDPIGSAMHHGRVAVAIEALGALGAHPRAHRRARARLERDIRQALRGRSVPGWPADPSIIAGTLALATRAGVDVRAELIRYAAQQPDAVSESAWHAAQICAVLGADAPRAAYAAAARDLEARPWAPWTAMAARAMGDGATLARCERALVASVRRSPPHAGGVGVTDIPELALTAVVVEALAASTSAAARQAIAGARAFVRRWQLAGDAIPGELDVDASAGAFPISPVCSVLRCDVTGHAVIALLGG